MTSLVAGGPPIHSPPLARWRGLAALVAALNMGWADVNFYFCERQPGAPAIDGDLEEEFWAPVSWSRPFTCVRGPGEGQSGPAATSPATRFKAALSGKSLHLAVECHEPRMDRQVLGLRPDQGRDQTVWFDDSLEIFFDPAGRHRNLYRLGLTPLNVQMDDLNAESRWDGPWQSSVTRKDSLWTAEIRLDLAGFVERVKAGERWGFDMGRCRRAGGVEEVFTWSGSLSYHKSPELYGFFIWGSPAEHLLWLRKAELKPWRDEYRATPWARVASAHPDPEWKRRWEKISLEARDLMVWLEQGAARRGPARDGLAPGAIEPLRRWSDFKKAYFPFLWETRYWLLLQSP